MKTFIEKSNKIHNNKYDYSKVNYTGSKNKITIICSEHGEFEQRPNEHVRGRGCRKCGKKSHLIKMTDTNQDFIEKASKIHNNKYDYSKTIYINSRTKLTIICPEHGEFEQRASAHALGQGCRKCRNASVGNRFRFDKDTFIEKANKIHNNVYDYSLVEYKNTKTKVKIICPIHGEFEQKPGSHLFKKSGCPICGKIKAGFNQRLTTETFIKRCKKIHKDAYDYTNTKYHLSFEYVTVKCNTCQNEFKMLANSHLNLKYGCTHCCRSVFEREIEDFLLSKNVLFEKNTRDVISPLELDIYLPDKKLAIECNGNYWHSELNGKGKGYHLNKTKACEEKGISLLHIFESEWVQKPEVVKSIISNKLKQSDRIYARRCEVKEVETSVKNEFLNENHLQGEDKSNIKLGLYYEGELVSLMTFIKSRFNKNYEWEISRFVSKVNTTIIGGASKLLSYFKRNYNPTSIITYADRRYSTGNLYKMLGFKFSHYSDPNYFYFDNNPLVLRSRIQFQKHKLKDKLNVFNSNLTEWENMKNNGYDRIWDCGNSVWSS